MIRRNPAYDIDHPAGVSHWSERSGEYKPGSSERLVRHRAFMAPEPPEQLAATTPLADVEKRLQGALFQLEWQRGVAEAAQQSRDAYKAQVKQLVEALASYAGGLPMYSKVDGREVQDTLVKILRENT